MRAFLSCLILLALAVPSAARPVVPGANHHLGDAGFVAAYGRPPTPRDSEALRMHAHFAYVHALLASRPATRPELAARRAQLLGYLEEYIARGVTPKNTYVAHRSPVFIDAQGQICAVGYLIERSAGRALAEKIAASHRLDYIEDIAAAMPEVAAWVEDSGFTLDEIASIQPGYEGPDVQHEVGFGSTDLVDGSYHQDDGTATFTGTVLHHEMTGAWQRVAKDGSVLGRGEFHHGAGTWTSFYQDGARMAVGPFAHSDAAGTWRIYYPSGRLAAAGPMRHGQRDGRWTFYYDTARHVVMSRGPFRGGETVGPWRHYAPDGTLVATASGTPWDHLMLSIQPGRADVRHEIDQGHPAEADRLDAFFRGEERIYILDRTQVYDGDGEALSKVNGLWVARACAWSTARRQAAQAGDTATLFRLLSNDRAEDCAGPMRPLTRHRSARIDGMLASRALLHAPIPSLPFSRVDDPADADAAAAAAPANTIDTPTTGDAELDGSSDNSADMATYLADNMTWYMEWPHVDDTFVALYRTLPGYRVVSDY